MAFDPLPEPLTALLLDRPGLPVLELGCGDGRFTRVLTRQGAVVWGLDLAPPVRGTVAKVVGDARRPPLRTGRWPVVVVANLLRHLAERGGAAPLVRSWLDLVGAGGSLWIMEDAPGGQEPAAANFEALQELLAGLPGRGPLLGLSDFLAELAAHGIAVAAAAEIDNRYPLDAVAVLAMLESGGPAPGTSAARLAKGIAADGIACGSYWWARLEPGT